LVGIPRGQTASADGVLDIDFDGLPDCVFGNVTTLVAGRRRDSRCGARCQSGGAGDRLLRLHNAGECCDDAGLRLHGLDRAAIGPRAWYGCSRSSGSLRAGWFTPPPGLNASRLFG